MVGSAAIKQGQSANRKHTYFFFWPYEKESTDIMFIFEPQCHTLVTFFLNLPKSYSAA